MHTRRCKLVTDAITTWSQYRGSRRTSTTGLLTPEEEFFLGRMVQSGVQRDKDKATAEFIDHNVRMVSAIAKKFRGRGCEHEDMLTDGMLGLHHAVQRYDPSLGHRFSTYATNWVRQAIGRGIESRGRDIRLPSHASLNCRTSESRDRSTSSSTVRLRHRRNFSRTFERSCTLTRDTFTSKSTHWMSSR